MHQDEGIAAAVCFDRSNGQIAIWDLGGDSLLGVWSAELQAAVPTTEDEARLVFAVDQALDREWRNGIAKFGRGRTVVIDEER